MTTQPNLCLDTDVLNKARALHRVWRALNDGDCPKCHHAVAATDVIRPQLKDGVWLKCPNDECGFYVLGEEITEIERMFAPAMDAAVAVFEAWRADRAGPTAVADNLFNLKNPYRREHYVDGLLPEERALKSISRNK
jgi:hypothetical protein